MTLRRPAAFAAVAVLFVLFCQFVTVHYNYGGNWTGLFCISPSRPVPDAMKSEHLWVFKGSTGYDGQMFHLIAHDPWIRRGSREALDAPALRYQRIFVPALAWIFALGNDQWIDVSYYAVILAFVFLGVFWLAQFAEHQGVHPAWGLAFLLTPATITSADRMTADIALAAFCVAFALFVEIGAPQWKIALVLACAALTKETTVLLIGGYGLFLITQRRIRDAIIVSFSAIPAAVWFLYVRHNAGRSEEIGYLNWIPLEGFLSRVFTPTPYHLERYKAVAGTVFDYVALAGIGIIFIFAARMAIQRCWNPRTAAIYALGVAAIFLRNTDVWIDVYNFGRVLTPLILLVVLERFDKRPLRALAPMFMITSRITLDLATQFLGVARGLLK